MGVLNVNFSSCLGDLSPFTTGEGATLGVRLCGVGGMLAVGVVGLRTDLCSEELMGVEGVRTARCRGVTLAVFTGPGVIDVLRFTDVSVPLRDGVLRPLFDTGVFRAGTGAGVTGVDLSGVLTSKAEVVLEFNVLGVLERRPLRVGVLALVEVLVLVGVFMLVGVKASLMESAGVLLGVLGV